MVSDKSATALNIVVLPANAVVQEAIKLSKNLAQQFPTEFVLNTTNFRPHITIYQGYFPDKNIVRLMEELERFYKNCANFELKTQSFWISPGRFVWWNVEKSPAIIKLHNDILRIANPLREGLIAPATQEQLSELGKSERENVEKTGAIYHGKLYVPHLTLTRLKNEIDREVAMKILGEIEPVNFTASKILVANLGNHGTISTTVREFKLGIK